MFLIGLAIGIAIFLISWFTRKLRPSNELIELRLDHAKKLSELQLQFQTKFSQMELQQRSEIDKAREQSVSQSRSTLNGQMAEKMAPLLHGFNYDPADSKFIGDPIDFVVFHGLAKARSTAGDTDQIEVVLIDVKYGKSNLNKYQRAIAGAISDGRVRFEIVQIDENLVVTKKEYVPKKNR
jgi:predicted Holliday junction resolvase-like endonuclease